MSDAAPDPFGAGPAWISGGVEDLDAEAALAEAVRLRRAADAAEARLLRVAGHWADLHAVLPGQPAAGLRCGMVVDGMERLVPLAGPGAPRVAEFAPAELGAALGMSTHAAGLLVGDALELRHRLPRLWGRVMAGDLPAWRARKIAEHTKDLPAEAARFVDAQVAAVAHKIGPARVLALVEAAVKRFDPQAAAKREKQAADGRGVWTSEQMIEGTRSIHIEADALDAEAFEHTIQRLADGLARLGDTDTGQVRRAKAVGVVADPQAALDLLDPPPGPSGAQHPGRRARSHGRRGGRPRVTLYVHLHQDAVTGGAGIARVEGLGAVTLAKIQDWLGRSDITLTPVRDLDSRVSVDSYEVPHDMRETVLLRNPCCPFPWCNHASRRKDTDHVKAYVPPDQGGPPGQTAPDNLAGLCRRHHRLKTHGGWTYSMPEPGLYLWRSPHGRRYLVDHTGTTNIDTS